MQRQPSGMQDAAAVAGRCAETAHQGGARRSGSCPRARPARTGRSGPVWQLSAREAGICAALRQQAVRVPDLGYPRAAASLRFAVESSPSETVLLIIDSVAAGSATDRHAGGEAARRSAALREGRQESLTQEESWEDALFSDCWLR
jgi:hypothetical protein